MASIKPSGLRPSGLILKPLVPIEKYFVHYCNIIPPHYDTPHIVNSYYFTLLYRLKFLNINNTEAKIFVLCTLGVCQIDVRSNVCPTCLRDLPLAYCKIIIGRSEDFFLKKEKFTFYLESILNCFTLRMMVRYRCAFLCYFEFLLPLRYSSGYSRFYVYVIRCHKKELGGIQKPCGHG